MQLSLDDDRCVDEAKVGAVLKALSQWPVRKQREMLKLYYKYLKEELRHARARLEHFGQLEAGIVQSLEERLAKTYSRKIQVDAAENAQLLAGITLKVGDDFYDLSVRGRLQRLQQSLN